MVSKNEEILNTHLRVENDQDLPSTLATLHPECIYEDVPTGTIRKGHKGASEHYTKWWNAFDLVVNNEKRFIAEDGTIILEQRNTGTHKGDFQGIAPTGNPVDFRVVTFVNFRDGLMAGERSYYDLNTILEQIQ